MCLKYTSIMVFLTLFLLFLGRSFQQLNLNGVGRNCLLGNRKKIAKFLMRTFTCRSTFLYANAPPPLPALSAKTHTKPPTNNLVIFLRRLTFALRSTSRSVAKFLVPDWGIYCRLCHRDCLTGPPESATWRADTTTYAAKVDFIPQWGAKSFASGLMKNIVCA